MKIKPTFILQTNCVAEKSNKEANNTFALLWQVLLHFIFNFKKYSDPSVPDVISASVRAACEFIVALGHGGVDVSEPLVHF